MNWVILSAGGGGRGRDPASIEIVTNMPEDPDEMAPLAAQGVTRMMVPVVGLVGVKDRGSTGLRMSSSGARQSNDMRICRLRSIEGII